MPSRVRLLLHVAPGLVSWAYLLLIIWEPFGRLRLWRFYPLQVSVAIVAFVAGLWACWMPARGLVRIFVIVGSIVGSMALAIAGGGPPA